VQVSTSIWWWLRRIAKESGVTVAQLGEGDGKQAQEARRKAFQRALSKLHRDYGREVLPDGEEVIWRL
jgi:hypothetical protein